MSKLAIRNVSAMAVLVALVASAYAYGQWTAKQEAAAYVYDVSTHLALSCTNEHVVALTDLREGKTEDAVRGLELLVAAKLEGMDVARIPSTTVAKKSFESLRAPLVAYQTKFPATNLDPKKNPRLDNVMRALN
jgi:hypothetical protein